MLFEQITAQGVACPHDLPLPAQVTQGVNQRDDVAHDERSRDQLLARFQPYLADLLNIPPQARHVRTELSQLVKFIPNGEDQPGQTNNAPCSRGGVRCRLGDVDSNHD